MGTPKAPYFSPPLQHGCPSDEGHLPCMDTFARIQKCPLKAGTTVFGKSQQTLYICAGLGEWQL